MPIETNVISRRDFTNGLAIAGLSATLPVSPGNASNAKEPLKLGIDNFAVRGMKWNDRQLVDYAAKLNVDVVFITDFYAFTSLDDRHLQDIRKIASDKGVEILLGNWSICPTSVRFKKDWGTAEEHLQLGIRAAKALGSPIFRVILGASPISTRWWVCSIRSPSNWGASRKSIRANCLATTACCWRTIVT